MKLLIAIALACLLSACATPYHSVYVNDSGDYYIAETESTNYYPNFAGSGSLSYIGMYPWWEFSYYSPYFYPYHFRVWHPGSYYSHHGWYSGYYPWWCPPYRSSSSDNRPVLADNIPLDPDDKPPLAPPVRLPPPSPRNLALMRDYEDLAGRRNISYSGSPAVLVRSQTVGGFAEPPRSAMPNYFSQQRGRQTFSQTRPSSNSRAVSGSSRAASASSRSSASRAPSRHISSSSSIRPTVQH